MRPHEVMKKIRITKLLLEIDNVSYRNIEKVGHVLHRYNAQLLKERTDNDGIYSCTAEITQAQLGRGILNGHFTNTHIVDPDEEFLMDTIANYVIID